MIREPRLIVDHRDAIEVFAELVRRRLGYVPDWLAADGDPATAVAQIFSRYMEAVIKRLNQAPDKNKLAFFDLLALGLVPAQSARAPIVFTLAQGAADVAAPAGTQVSAPAPPGSSTPLIFETEKAAAVMAASLVEAVSLWPGRDQYIDHSAALAGRQPFTLFDPLKLTDTPHAIYVAHDVLLALAGRATLEVKFDLSQASQEPLDVVWEYWDGDVWRRFKEIRPACAVKGAPIGDSTRGLTESGRYLLETECAESVKREVNGAKKFWIRGVLDEPLTPATGDADRLLPEVESVTLSSMISQPLELEATESHAIVNDLQEIFGLPEPDAIRLAVVVRVVNEAGEYLPGVAVSVAYAKDGTTEFNTTGGTASERYLTFSEGPGKVTISVTYLGMTVTLPEIEASPIQGTAVLVTLHLTSIELDEAFADATSLELTKPFYPFGQQPGPGSAFYFTSEEVFTKPGAQFRLFFARTMSPLDVINVQTSSSSQPRVRLTPTVAWEYWNGREWSALLSTQSATMDQTGAVDLTVPDDLEPVKVNDKEARWMRARVVSGTFGFSQEIVWTTGANHDTNTYTYVVMQPPVLSSIALGYSWRYGPFPPEMVVTHNDFKYADRTFEARWPGATFPPFERIADTTPAAYLGFDKRLPVDGIGLYIDLVEEPDSSVRAPLTWEYWNGSEWRQLSFDDETHHLRVPGILQFIGPDDGAALARFGTSRYWIRGRLKEDGPPGEVVINRLYPNAVWASERRTLVNVPLGASAGVPGERFQITPTPVLDGEQIEVREIAGARADVEWRILARELAPGDPRAIATLEDRLAQEGSQVEVPSGRLRLRRDRNRRVVEAWVRWESRPHLFLSGPSDRHYAIDRAQGVVLFGDGVNGKVPPPGAQIRAAMFRSGGGSLGNVAAGAIAQLLGPLAGVQSVANPKPAEGGADRESMERFRDRAPRTLRHRGRAISAADYETLAREASPAVAFVRAVPLRTDGGRRRPGWVTLIIAPESADPRPYPSEGLRRHVREFLTRRAPADVAALSRIHVTGPRFFAVGVNVTLAPIDAAEAGIVERRARTSIEAFLHPLRGGPERRGWDLGRDVYLSDLAAVIEQTEGVDYVQDLALLVDGVPQGERVAVADDRLVTSGTIRVRVIADERQRAIALSASREAL